MTIGIYLLSYNDYEHVYVGQSVNIELRIVKHNSLLRHNKHYNHKLTNLYNLHGVPVTNIIEICQIKELNHKENTWIQEFDSYNNGINLRTIELTSNKGAKHSQAKFSEEQIIDVFELLLDPYNLVKDISSCTEVSEGMVSMIACGQSHRWLEERFPDRYKLLLSIVGLRRVQGQSARGKGIVYPTIIDPYGNEYSNIENAKAFAEKHKLCYSQLSKVLKRFNGAVSVKGWKLK